MIAALGELGRSFQNRIAAIQAAFGGADPCAAVQGPTVRITDARLTELAERLERAAADVAPLLAAAGP